MSKTAAASHSYVSGQSSHAVKSNQQHQPRQNRLYFTSTSSTSSIYQHLNTAIMVQTHTSSRLRTSPQNFWKLHFSPTTTLAQFRRNLLKTSLHISSPCPRRLRLKLPFIDSRAQRGMLLYEICTLTELFTFCHDRGISTSHINRRVIKSDLIQLLEAADESPVFQFFEELPPELRLRIYGFSFEFFRHEDQVDSPPGWDRHYIFSPKDLLPETTTTGWTTEADDLTLFARKDLKDYDIFRSPPPPVSRVCRLLREEATSLFYQGMTLVSHLPLHIMVHKHW